MLLRRPTGSDVTTTCCIDRPRLQNCRTFIKLTDVVTQWRNDGVAAATSDCGPAPLVVGGPRQF